MSETVYVIRYRTHGPWQSERVEGTDTETAWQAAVRLSEELSKSYTDVVVDMHREMVRYRNGTKI